MRALLVAFLVAACGNSSSHSPDAAAPDAPADARPDTPPMMRSGLITLGKLHDTNGMNPNYNATAQFTVGSIYGMVMGSDGPCTLLHNPPTAGLSAGAIAITGLMTSITLTPSGTPAKYTSSPDPIPITAYPTGGNLAVGAPGAEFPAFSTMVTVPAPLAGFTTPTMISRAAGYHVTWTAGTAQGMWLLIVDPIGSNNVEALLCKIPDTGSYTVTPAALALLRTAATSVYVTLARVDLSNVTVVNGTVDVVVFEGVATPASTTLNP